MFDWLKKKENASLTEVQEEAIHRAEALISLTRSKVKEQGSLVNLTSQLQLRDDCQRVEKLIKDLRSKPTDAGAEKLANALLRLQTTSENILMWKFSEEYPR